jgi:glycosyltransferase involved in cell wall biosynthesis
MGMGAACVPIDVVFNREVLGEDGRFFNKEAGSLARIIEELEADDAGTASLGSRARERARTLYRWDAVAAGYAQFFTHLVEARRKGPLVGKPAIPDVYRPEAFAERYPGGQG